MKSPHFNCSKSVLILLMLGGIFNYTALHAQYDLICPTSYSLNTNASTHPVTAGWNQNLPLGLKKIPTVVHSTQYCGDLEFLAQNAINYLNQYFAAANGDFTIQFVLATIDPQGNCTNGIDNRPEIADISQIASDPANNWPNGKYLNIWVFRDLYSPGVAKTPSTFQEDPDQDQVLQTDHIAGNDPAFDATDYILIDFDKFNLSPKILVHEVGHWLNLLHVFTPNHDNPDINFHWWNSCHPADSGNVQGDFMMDTNPQDFFVTDNQCFPIETCNMAGNLVNKENFMSYGGECVNSFTQNQREWMFVCLRDQRAELWSDHNLRCTGVNTVYPKQIPSGQNIVWDLSNTPGGERQINGVLTIKKGATLTIGTGIIVRFCDQGKLVVENGATLTLYGTLTRACSGKQWEGVEVWGVGNAPQIITSGSVQQQGQFIGKPGAVIEFAHVGILVNNPNPNNPQPGQTFGGGIVNCDRVTFRNNVGGVQFAPYEGFLPAGSHPVADNVSTFNRCTFINDGESNGAFARFAHLSGVRNIRFVGCTFDNGLQGTSLFTPILFGSGIYATGASFSVVDHCAGSSLPCSAGSTTRTIFKNLFEAISIGQTGINTTFPLNFTIQHAQFSNCFLGVRIDQSSYGNIVQNDFYLGALPDYIGGTEKIYGMYLIGTQHGFTIEENNFQKDPNTPAGSAIELIGIVCQSLGSMDNQIRKNNFTNLTIGNQAKGTNNYYNPNNPTPPDLGLVYLCNTNTGNTNNDFLVIKELGQGIRGRQGVKTADPNTYLATGNIFSHIGPTPLNFTDFYNEGSHIFYYYNPNIPAQLPLFYNTTNMELLQADANTCSSILKRPRQLAPSDIANHQLALSQEEASYDSLYTLYAQNPSDGQAQARRQHLSWLQQDRQARTSELVADIIASGEGHAAYRTLLANLNQLDTDIELVTDDMGAGNHAAAAALLNALPSKYQLTGDALAEFNALKSVLDLLIAHIAAGGNKYNLDSTQVQTLVSVAETNVWFRARQFAKVVLRLYGYYYPLEEETFAEDRTLLQRRGQVPGMAVFPNPAGESVTVQFDKASSGEILLIDLQGKLVFQRHVGAAEQALVIPLHAVANGYYFLKFTLEKGESYASPLVINH